jgi:hypothetical protein
LISRVVTLHYFKSPREKQYKIYEETRKCGLQIGEGGEGGGGGEMINRNFPGEVKC